MRRFLFVICPTLICCGVGFSGETEVPLPPSSIEAIRTSDIITIDGNLSEPVWQRAGVTAFRQRDPDEGKPATEYTEVWLAYDEQAVYVAARLHDRSPDSIVVRLVRRDGEANSDDFGVFFDSYHDHRSGNYFGLNAAGTQYDGVLYNDDWDDNTWDGVWEGKVQIDQKGWTAEMRIPYSQLRFQKEEKQVWGVNFIREIGRKNEKDYLTYTPRNESGFVSRFVHLVGIEKIDPPRRFEALPYVSTKAEYTSHAPGDPFNDGSRYSQSAGADMKFGIGSNLTVDATVNPDFGQVEVDPAVVNLSDVETFYEEKRPFFIEGSTIFNFGYGGSNNNWGFNWGNPDFFYSRRIGRPPQGSVPSADYADVPSGTHILGAAKITGKLGDSWNVGSINALTKREYAELDTSGHRFDAEVEPLTYYGVFRGQKEFNTGRQGFGFISTVGARNFSDIRLRDELSSTSFALAFDGWTFLDSSKTWVINGWTGMTNMWGNKTYMIDLQHGSRHYFQRPDASHVEVDSSATLLQGFGGRLALNKQKGSFYVNSAVGFIDPGFDPSDLGFIWRTDVINGHLVIGYRWQEPNTITRTVNLYASTFRSYDFGKNLIWAGYWTNGYVQFLNYYGVSWWFAYNPESYSNRRTRGGPLTLNPRGYEIGGEVSSDDRKVWVADVSANFQKYEYGIDHSRNLSASLQYKPAANVSLGITPSLNWYNTSAQWVDNISDATATETFGSRYIFADLDQQEISASIRLDWTFTPKLSLQLYLQPLISVGQYTNFKELAQPKSLDFNIYGEGSSTIARQGGDYLIDPDGAGPAPEFTVSDPDFNFKSLRGSAVLRWEYMPGSTIYFVWTQQRTDDSNPGQFKFGRDFGNLMQSQPDNVFMIKLTYWANP
jgi:hypothetical protein